GHIHQVRGSTPMKHTAYQDDHLDRASARRHSKESPSSMTQTKLSCLPKREPFGGGEMATLGGYRRDDRCDDVAVLHRVAAGIRALTGDSTVREHEIESDTARLQREIDGVISRWRESHPGRAHHDR